MRHHVRGTMGRRATKADDATEADRRLADRKDSDARSATCRQRGSYTNRGPRSHARHQSGRSSCRAGPPRARGDRRCRRQTSKQQVGRGAKQDQAASRRLVQARAAKNRLGWNEDFSGEAGDENFGIGQRRQVGRIAELRQKTLDAGVKVGREKQEADSDQQLLGATAAEVRKRQDAGNDAELANVRKTEEQLAADIKKTAEENKRVQDLAKTFHANVSQFDKKGNLLPADKQAERLQKARSAGSEILALTLDSKDEGLNTKLASLQAEIAKKLTDEEIGHLRLAPDALDGVHEQIQAAGQDSV